MSAIRAIDDVFFAAMMHKQWEDFNAEQHAYFSAWPEHEQREFMSVLQGLERCKSLMSVISSSCQSRVMRNNDT